MKANPETVFFLSVIFRYCSFKGTLAEKTPSNKTAMPAKSTNMGIWVVGTSNQLFIIGS